MRTDVVDFLKQGDIIIHIKSGLSYRFYKAVGSFKIMTECRKIFNLYEVKSEYCDIIMRGSHK